MLNVDPALLDYGNFVSSSLREAGASLRGVGGRSRTRQMDATSNYSYDYWGYSGTAYYRGYGHGSAAARDEAANRARIRTEERVKGAREVREVMQDVASATLDVRRKMTEKYKAEF